MKKIELYFLIDCPHCQKAFGLLKDALIAEPKYKSLRFELIEEELSPALAEERDYYYVPCFFLDGKKVHEGKITERDINKILKDAYKE
ncbi:MAG: thioredoxin family protein [Clostridiales bacterium]|nr:thioredoxin family protein [Clostridiales bacterium]